MVLETSRLVIRNFILDDLDDLARILANPEVMRFSISGPLNREQTDSHLKSRILEHYQKYGYGLWALILKQNQTLIGFAGLITQQIDGEEKVELGYRLDPDYWGCGLAREAARAICHYAFSELKIDELISIIDPLNVRSLNLARSIGMKHLKNTTFHAIPVEIHQIIFYLGKRSLCS